MAGDGGDGGNAFNAAPLATPNLADLPSPQESPITGSIDTLSTSRLEAILSDPLLADAESATPVGGARPDPLLTRTPLLFGDDVEESPTLDRIRVQVDALAALAGDPAPGTPAAAESARPLSPPTDAAKKAEQEEPAPQSRAETAGEASGAAGKAPEAGRQKSDVPKKSEDAPLPRLTPQPQPSTSKPAAAEEKHASWNEAVLDAADAASLLRRDFPRTQEDLAAASPAAAALAESAAILAEDFDARSRMVRRDLAEIRTSLAGVTQPSTLRSTVPTHSTVPAPPVASHRHDKESTSGAGAEMADLVRELGAKYGANAVPEMPQEAKSRPSVAPVAEALDRMLRDAGFAGTGARLDAGEVDTSAAKAVRRAMVEVLGQYERRGKLVQELLATSELSRSKEFEMERALSRLQAERDDATKALAEAERRISAARDAGATEGAVSSEKLRETTRESRRFAQRCVQLEHKVRSLERDNQSMRARLADQVKEDERGRQKGLAAIAKLRRSGTSPAGKTPPRVHTTGPVSAAEVATIYERDRENVVVELDTLKAENRRISEELIAARQEILRKDGSGGWRTPEAGELLEKVSRAESNALESRRRAAEAESNAANAIKASETQRFSAERKAESLAEEVASLTLEIDARPTQRDLKAAKRAVELLERKLNAISTRYPDLVEELEEEIAHKLGEHATGGSDPAAHVRWAERASPAEEAFEGAIGSSAFGRMALTDRERMRRDREVHRRGLKRLERLPRDALAGALQDACLAIGCQGDLASLQEGIAVVKRANAAIPRLENFVRTVCAIVLRDGADLVSEPGMATLADGPGDPNAAAGGEIAGEAGRVPRLLRAWLTSLRELGRTRGFVAHVRSTLADRSSANDSGGKVGDMVSPGGAPDLAAMASAVRDLVEAERALLLTKQNLAGAEEALHFVVGGSGSVPAQLERGAAVALAAVAAQAHRLFGNGGKGPGGREPTVEGLIPLMNRAYLAHSEARNALKDIRASLGCTPACTLPELTARVKDLVAACGEELFRSDEPAPADRHFANLANLPRDPNRELLDDYRDVVRKPRQVARAEAIEAKRGGTRVDVGDAVDFDRNPYARACRSAMHMYAVERPAQLIEAVRSHLAETTKLRSALKKHHEVAGEMCELLHCSNKEELPTTVRELVRRVQEAIEIPHQVAVPAATTSEGSS
ncbi:centrosomal protein [Pseudoscourfieldia marina]